MSHPIASARPLSPTIGSATPALIKLGAVLAGTGLLTVSSWVHVPMIPVPITLQVLAVLLLGAAFGARLAVLTVVAWLAEAAAGLPVLAGGGLGLATLVGPRGGYLLGFALAAGLVGWSVKRGLAGVSLARTFAVLLLADGLILTLGGLWLARFTGLQAAWTGGVVPFLPGDLLKVALATALLHASGRLFRGRLV